MPVKKKTSQAALELEIPKPDEDLEKQVEHILGLEEDKELEPNQENEEMPAKKTTAKKGSKKKSTKKTSSKKASKKKSTKQTEEEEFVNPMDSPELAEELSLTDSMTLNFEIKDLPGVGPSTARKLAEAGFHTVNSLAKIPMSKLVDQGGIGEKTAEKIIQAAREALNIGYKTADLIWEKRKNLARISTSSKSLDDMFGGGGIETGGITELFGQYRSGKTQICHQLCVNVQRPKEEGGLDARALYIDTEGTFRPERLIQMAEGAGMDPEAILKNVIVARAYSSDHQAMLAKDAARIIAARNVKLVIVDSLISHFRSEFIGRGNLANRQQLLNAHLHDLLRLTEIFPDLAVVLTNQVQSKPDCFFGDPNKATGGNIVAHGATVRVYVRKGKKEQRVAKVVDAPNLPESEAIYVITEGGIIDAE